jgi:hypothetical protein
LQLYTYSLFVRAAGETKCFIQPNPGNNANVPAGYFDLINLTTATQDLVGTVANKVATITPIGGGWLWCSLSFTIPTGQNSLVLYLGPTDSMSTRTYTATTGNGIHVWGAQGEPGTVRKGYVKRNLSTEPYIYPGVGRENSIYAEGLHAWEWFDTKNELPASHPFKNRPPLIGD